MTFRSIVTIFFSILFFSLVITSASASDKEWILNFNSPEDKETFKYELSAIQILNEMPRALLISGSVPDHPLIKNYEQNVSKQANAEISPDVYATDQWGLSAVNQSAIQTLYPEAGKNLLDSKRLIINDTDLIENTGPFNAQTIEIDVGTELSRISLEIEENDIYWGIEAKDEKGNLIGMNYGRFSKLDIIISNKQPVNKIHLTLLNENETPSSFTVKSLMGVNNPLVAVLDSGVAMHEDFCSNILYSLSKDYTDESFSWAQDTYGHGTHITGILASCYNNGVGTAGVFGYAPIDILPMKVLNERGTGTDFQISQALYDAIELDVSAVNLSIAGKGKTDLLKNAILEAAIREIPIIAAAGNYNSSTEAVYPASYPTVITVSGVNQQMKRVGTSNFGWEVDLTAPGFEVLSTYTDPVYKKLNGTSMAAPFVTGAAAILKHQYPDDSILKIRQKLFGSAEDIMAQGYDIYSGNGLVQFQPEKWENTPLKNIEWMNYRNGQPYRLNEFHLLTDSEFTGDQLQLFVNGRSVFSSKIDSTYQSIEIDAPIQPAFKLFTVISDGDTILEQSYLNLAPNAQASFTFTDTARAYWAYEEIMNATTSGIINGYEDQTFRPDAPISRRHAALMMNRLLEWDSLPSMKSTFSDIEKFDFMTKYSILSANHEKVLNGYEGGYFKPDQQLSRGQMALILFRALHFEESNSEIELLFNDISPENEIFSALIELVSKGIVTNQKEFNPYESISRAQFSAMISRAQHYMNTQKEEAGA
ncbi:S8 family peptidase [Jeotgalibacillus salarius]|uniref:S8 family peptidase n=1 Tax=Jeotgalibacillus salarius TaxID=546023 RepID=UPI00141B0239|nr:S8 family serine peptidase [Jeotgalibacillus salarius]